MPMQHNKLNVKKDKLFGLSFLIFLYPVLTIMNPNQIFYHILIWRSSVIKELF